MARKIFYLFGGEGSVYENPVDYKRYRFYLCDTGSDLPSPSEEEFAVVKETNSFYYTSNGKWYEVKGKEV